MNKLSLPHYAACCHSRALPPEAVRAAVESSVRGSGEALKGKWGSTRTWKDEQDLYHGDDIINQDNSAHVLLSPSVFCRDGSEETQWGPRPPFLPSPDLLTVLCIRVPLGVLFSKGFIA